MKKINYNSVLLTGLIISLIGIALFTQSCTDSVTKDHSLYNKGKDFRKKKKYPEALDLYQKAAFKGDAAAMNEIGWMYEYGEGVSIDYQKAMEWYQKAAQAKYDNAINRLNLIFEYMLIPIFRINM